MTGTPVDIVRRVLSDPTNPAVVNELVAEDSVYVSLNYQDKDPKKIMPIVYAQFMEDSFATARSFRSAGTWTISSDPDGHTIEV
jgi:hypothetical protein